MVYITCNKDEIFVQRCCTDKQIEMVDFLSYTFQLPADVAIFLQTIGDRVLFKKIFNHIHILEVLLFS